MDGASPGKEAGDEGCLWPSSGTVTAPPGSRWFGHSIKRDISILNAMN